MSSGAAEREGPAEPGLPEEEVAGRGGGARRGWAGSRGGSGAAPTRVRGVPSAWAWGSGRGGKRWKLLGGAGAARSWVRLGGRGLGRRSAAGRSDARGVRARRRVPRERRWRRGAPLGGTAAAHAASLGTAAGSRDGGPARLLAGPLPAHHEVGVRRRPAAAPSP